VRDSETASGGAGLTAKSAIVESAHPVNAEDDDSDSEDTLLSPYGYADILDRYFAASIDIMLVSLAVKLGGVDSLLTVVYELPAFELMGYVLLPMCVLAGIMDSSSLQGTPGKIISGLKVVDGGGNRPGALATIFRNICKMLYLISVVGILMDLIFRGRDTIYDRLTNTYVVRSRNKDSLN